VVQDVVVVVVDEAEELPEEVLVAVVNPRLDLADELVETLTMPLPAVLPEASVELGGALRSERARAAVLVKFGMALDGRSNNTRAWS
jgi:hypothetical protein